ncbi:hypothetical protein FRC03_010276 [Tulasnella sp. 419]|nr:hypothetical protein FRC03_010276 [Tulasnella sp. 419]
MQSFPPSRATSRTRTLTGGTNGSTNGTNGTNGANGSGRNGSPPSRWDTLPIGPEAHPAFHAGGCALITGGASGIGLAAAKEFARLGLRIVIADANEQDLKHAADELTDIVGTQNVCAALVDVSKLDHVEKFRDQVYETFGEVNVLLNNAGVGDYGGALSNPEAWRKVMDVNLFGVLNVVQTFAPSMIHQENPSMIINTGSKQGITNPP